MPFLIDGNNLMGTLRGFRMDDPEAQHRLVRKIASWQRIRKKGILVVFDGPAPESGRRPGRNLGGVTVRYSGAGVTADDTIVALLEKSGPEHYLLVTSDRELQVRARRLRVKVQDCREFLREMEEGEGAEESRPAAPRLSQEEVEEWLRIFGRKNGRSR